MSRGGDALLLLYQMIPTVISVWNASGNYSCSDFRNDSDIRFFTIWPEESKYTHYCCDDGKGNVTLANFTYSPDGGVLDPRPYFDLGIVGNFSPYLKNWNFWDIQTESGRFPLHCDYNDIHRLYVHRFWSIAVKDGLVVAVLLVVSMQIAVSVFVLMLWRRHFFCDLQLEHERRAFLYSWLRTTMWGDLAADCIHLVLLALVGSTLVEATGHSDLQGWRANFMLNSAAVYSYVTLFTWLSSVLRQVGYRWYKEECQTLKHMDGKTWRIFKRVSDDWRWQRIWGQLAVFILMGAYLSFVDDDSGSGMDTVASIVLAAMVIACIWSGGVAAVVAVRAMVYLFFCFLNNAGDSSHVIRPNTSAGTLLCFTRKRGIVKYEGWVEEDDGKVCRTTQMILSSAGFQEK